MRLILSRLITGPAICLLVCFWASSSTLRAAQLDLYRGTVPVEDQSPAQRTEAIRRALDQVLIRVSGRRQAPAIVDTQSETLQIERYVQRSQYERLYQYPSLAAFQELPPKEPSLHLSVVFTASFVEDLLTRSNLPLWGSNRQEMLVWLVLDTPSGAQMIAEESHPAIEMLRATGEVRGLPIMLPLMDLDDQIHFDAATAWAGHRGSFKLASQRYGAHATLLGRLESPFAGLWQARWSLLKDERITEWSSRGPELEAVLAGGMDRSADDLGREFAVYVSADDQNEVVLTVRGVDSLQAYDRVLDYLSALTVVTAAAPKELQADQVQFALSLRGGRQSLVTLLNRGNVLERDDDAFGAFALQYKLRP